VEEAPKEEKPAVNVAEELLKKQIKKMADKLKIAEDKYSKYPLELQIEFLEQIEEARPKKREQAPNAPVVQQPTTTGKEAMPKGVKLLKQTPDCMELEIDLVNNYFK
jgi:hypothetical protein